MDERGFCGNCDNSEQHEIRYIGEGLIVMKPDALARTCFKPVCLIQSISLQSGTIMASNSSSSGGNRLHRPGGAGFVCVKEEEWEELMEQVVLATDVMRMVKEVMVGDEEAKEEAEYEVRRLGRLEGEELDSSIDSAPGDVTGSEADRMASRLSVARRRLFDAIRRVVAAE